MNFAYPAWTHCPRVGSDPVLGAIFLRGQIAEGGAATSATFGLVNRAGRGQRRTVHIHFSTERSLRYAADLAGVVADIFSAGHVSLRAIATELEARGMRTRRGGPWQVSSVRPLLGRLDA